MQVLLPDDQVKMEKEMPRHRRRTAWYFTRLPALQVKGSFDEFEWCVSLRAQSRFNQATSKGFLIEQTGSGMVKCRVHKVLLYPRACD